MPLTLLQALGVLTNDDVISNLLANSINSSPRLGKAMLRSLQGETGWGCDEVKAYSRRSSESHGIPDIILKMRTGDKCRLLIIENKLRAAEGKDQTKKYASHKCLRSLQARPDIAGPHDIWGDDADYVFLTLDPWQRPASPRFRHVTYQQLLSAPDLVSPDDDPTVAKLLGELRDAYLAFYAIRPRPHDLILEKLQATSVLDERLIYFGRLCEQVGHACGLALWTAGHLVKEGRDEYLGVISKPRWRVAPKDNAPGYHVHVEPHFHVGTGTVRLHLHYETGDYHKKAEAQSLYGEHLAGYHTARRAFLDYLRQVRPPGVRVTGTWNQAAKLPDVRLDDQCTAQELVRAVTPAIAEVADVVDRFFA